MRFKRSLSIILLAALGASAEAGTKAGVTMPDQIEVGGKRLVLNGMGLREATAFKIDVYVAGLYVETPSSDAGALVTSNEAKRIVLTFVRGVDRGKILEAWHAGFKGNATVPLVQIQKQMNQLDKLMTDFHKGDTLSFLYVPGQGVAVDVNNVRKGVIGNEEFARSLFAIWLGGKPPTTALKRGLLGNHAAST